VDLGALGLVSICFLQASYTGTFVILDEYHDAAGGAVKKYVRISRSSQHKSLRSAAYFYALICIGVAVFVVSTQASPVLF